MKPGTAVLLLAAVLVGWNLWGYDLWSPDEPYFGEGAREMIADGQWLVPHVGGRVTTDKPPLFFWLIALLSLPLGRVVSLTARLPGALAAVGSVALTLRLARRGGCGERTAALAGAMLATSWLFWRQGRAAQIDSLLCFLVLVAISAFAAFRAGEARGRRAGLLFWSAAAFAVLAKGPVGLLLPLGVALATLAWDRDLAAWRRFAPLAGPLLFTALATPWAVAATLGSGGEYSVLAALEKHFVARAVLGMHHVEPPWYYLTRLPPGLLPWTGIVAGGVLLAWRRRRRAEDRLLLVWGLLVVAIFTLSTEKRDLYVLPAFPAFALLGARLVGGLAGWWPAGEGPDGGRRVKVPSRRWATLSQGAVGAAFAALGLSLPFLRDLPRFAGPTAGLDLGLPLAVVATVLAAGGAAMLAAAARGRTGAAVAATAATAAVLYLAVASLLLPAFDPAKSVRGLAREMRERTIDFRAAGGEVVTCGLGNLPRALSFYSDGVYFEELADAAALARRLERPGEAWVVAAARELAALPAPAREGLETVARSRTVGVEVVLAHRPAAPGAAPPAPSPEEEGAPAGGDRGAQRRSEDPASRRDGSPRLTYQRYPIENSAMSAS